jgi:glycosyltransferase involved in cell wall biosynthesis
LSGPLKHELPEKSPLVSIIIPTKNSENTIEECLKSIRAQTFDNIEIIVVDNYSKDKTVPIATRYGAKIFSKGPERGAQVNFGVANANGRYLYRVDSDFVLQPDVVREAVENCENHGYDAIAIHNTSDPTVSFWAKVRKAERDCYRNDELNVAARFWKRETFAAVGGFDETLVAADDYDLHNRLLKRGYKIGRIKSEEIHLGEPKTLADVFRKHYFYGQNIEHFIGKDPRKALEQLNPLRRSYRTGFPELLRNPLLMAGFVIYQFVRYTAATVGIVSCSFERVHAL